VAVSERGKKRVDVADLGSTDWAGREDDAEAQTRSLSLEQQLELIDRVKSLEAQLAQVTANRHLTPTEQLSAEQQLLEFRRSLPWRVGRMVTVPVRVLQRAARRLRRR
jgi:hypothetical protein